MDTFTALAVTVITETTDKYQKQVDVGKWVAIPLVFIIILFACLVPHILLKLKKGVGLAIALATSLSGGAILGIGLMHILPHADEYWALYLIPTECGGHAGHNHMVIQPSPINTIDISSFNQQKQYQQYQQQSQQLHRLSTLRSLKIDTTDNALVDLDNNNNNNNNINNNDDNIEEYNMEITQNIDPIDPITLIPTPVAPSDVDCPDGHIFPWAQLCCGLIIMLLMATESLLHTYLSKRGPNAVHLHDHGDGEQCGHGHGHEHNHKEHNHKHNSSSAENSLEDKHTHGHNQHNHSHTHGNAKHTRSHHHKDGAACDAAGTGNCLEEVIELTPPPDEVEREVIAAPDGSIQNGNENKQNNNQNNKNNNIQQDDDDEDEYAKRTREIVEGADFDDHGHQLTPEEQNRLRFRRTVDAYISAFAISLHCVFNGLSIGVFTAENQNQASSFWTLFGATVGHKLMDGFAVGIPLMRANLPRMTNLIIAILVAIATPIGILIGHFASNVKTESRYLAQAILMSLSSGSFFYIALLELIPNGTKGKDWVPLRWLFVCIGFAISAIIAKWA